ncbi:BAR-domain-containing protein [Epithele typhae]|uniref:BAR-domain-containing protein n=1 Tax=Epithele typhae TaxID=378194 RepID=UPI002007ADFA|nr:BAR-domain-containing protein [Epithele typhae]KAH9916575.1 BAR-domain-containing protein [Epithele typhae]
MASKQLGKLRQLVGEAILSRDKTIQSDEFRELEHDVELRRQGLWRLDVASEDLRHHLMKKRLSEVAEAEEKLLPIDALGVVMIKHGEEFGDDSAYGLSLVNLGRTHCNIASLQESFASTFEETYLTAVRQSEDDIKEYLAQRKKLESRRVSYDAATSKLEKIRHTKKATDKDREEVEDEFENAKARYEETLEDVRVRMRGIQDNEVVQLRELTSFLDLEITYVRSYLDELEKAKASWVDETTLKKLGAPKARPPPRVAPVSRAGSIKSTKSARKGEQAEDSSDDEATSKKSHGRSKSEAGSKPPSRAPSRASRKRADSAATAVSEKEDKEKDKDKEKEKKAEKSSNRLSLAGWGSIMGRGKKDKEKRRTRTRTRRTVCVARERRERNGRVRRHEAQAPLVVPAIPSSSPKIPTRLLKSSSKESQRSDDSGQKRVIALHDFAAGSTDELSFKVGDQIVVVSEVLDGWWMGELGGKRGLFPTTYTEIINSSTTSLSKPPLPQRPPSSATRNSALAATEGDDTHPFSDQRSRPTTSAPNGSGASLRGKSKPKKKYYEPSIDSMNSASVRSGSDVDSDDAGSLVRVQRVDDSFSSVYITGLPTPQSPAAVSPVAASKTSGLAPTPFSSASGAAAPPPIPVRRNTESKKAPPPPPPRRSTLSMSTSSVATPPAVPSRPATLRSKSSNGPDPTRRLTLGDLSSGDPDGLTHSPFDSPREPGFGCTDFKQNPFKPVGFCNNCFKTHY